MTLVDPYDELPYRCLPIEWTAPERLSVASLLHGGPRQPGKGYRVLELGCGNGANLLPQAYYRRHSAFVGVDGARTQVEIAESSRSELGLTNLEFIHADFLRADERLDGQFDYIVGHGIFSWVSDEVRDALLRLCATRLRDGGLLYLNYNANPGWNVRGMVRDFLLAQTARECHSLRVRAETAREIAATMRSALPPGDHAYSRLLANEFAFVCENDISYVAHEYLTAENHPYWRSEFMTLLRADDFEYVADADFNYSSGRLPDGVESRLIDHHIIGRSVSDTVDLLCYRQLHTPILTRSPLVRAAARDDEFAALFVASCLSPCEPSDDGLPMFVHPTGYRVETRSPEIQSALEALHSSWPRGRLVGEMFPAVDRIMDDLRLLHRNGLVELRGTEPSQMELRSEPLHALEAANGGYVTTPYHTRELPLLSAGT